MTSGKSENIFDNIQRLPVNFEEHKFNDWIVKYTKSHILHSQCNTSHHCKENPHDVCQYCLYNNTLELPHLPEMVFPNNVLTVKHDSGVQFEFNALDALKPVKNSSMALKVAYADVWKESRDPNFLEEKFKPFDWTFSTDYKGTVSGDVVVTQTEERIDIEKLKQKEKILFYHELMLFEDELHDNGIASCTVKIRVMPSSFFILLRYFLRVDNVMVRVNDTRVYHEFNTNHILREYTSRESGFRDIKLPLPMFGDPNLLSPHLPLRNAINEKFTFKIKSEQTKQEIDNKVDDPHTEGATSNKMEEM
ncbi:TIP41-like protein [Agrilus planipennis]|uniref:TIP41-like protein n=1 Tax=Agrilus planipennis TaxID=224129 RepID=A0A1W4XU35_AGRPL|nr:TIP41-like protein [Agrilus planipennis]